MSEPLPEDAILKIAEVQLRIEEIIRELEDVDFETEEDRAIVITLLAMAFVKGWEERFYFEHPDAPRAPEIS